MDNTLSLIHHGVTNILESINTLKDREMFARGVMQGLFTNKDILK